MSELIRECPNDECEHKQDNSKMCYSCGWLEAKHHLLPTPDSKEYLLTDEEYGKAIKASEEEWIWNRSGKNIGKARAEHTFVLQAQVDKVLALLGGKE